MKFIKGFKEPFKIYANLCDKNQFPMNSLNSISLKSKHLHAAGCAHRCCNDSWSTISSNKNVIQEKIAVGILSQKTAKVVLFKNRGKNPIMGED